jgi:hypothetical protein
MTQAQQLPQLPETIEEHQETAPDDDSDHTSVPVDGGDGRGLQQQQQEWEEEDDEQLRQIEEDLQSELSFSSAYSHPRESPKLLQHMETTV